MSRALDNRTMYLRHQELADGCSFKLRPRQEWRFYPTASSPRLMRGLARGESSGPHAKVRCPECGRRLALRAMYNSGSGEEFWGWEIPEHRERVIPPKTPRRKSRLRGRGQ